MNKKFYFIAPVPYTWLEMVTGHEAQSDETISRLRRVQIFTNEGKPPKEETAEKTVGDTHCNCAFVGSWAVSFLFQLLYDKHALVFTFLMLPCLPSPPFLSSSFLETACHRNGCTPADFHAGDGHCCGLIKVNPRLSNVQIVFIDFFRWIISFYIKLICNWKLCFDYSFGEVVMLQMSRNHICMMVDEKAS